MKMSSEMYARIELDCLQWLGARGLGVEDVPNLCTAWCVASAAGVLTYVYRDGLADSHIDTALKRLFKH